MHRHYSMCLVGQPFFFFFSFSLKSQKLKLCATHFLSPRLSLSHSHLPLLTLTVRKDRNACAQRTHCLPRTSSLTVRKDHERSSLSMLSCLQLQVGGISLFEQLLLRVLPLLRMKDLNEDISLWSVKDSGYVPNFEKRSAIAYKMVLTSAIAHNRDASGEITPAQFLDIHHSRSLEIGSSKEFLSTRLFLDCNQDASASIAITVKEQTIGRPERRTPKAFNTKLRGSKQYR